jgi:hypothetical protein
LTNVCLGDDSQPAFCGNFMASEFLHCRLRNNLNTIRLCGSFGNPANYELLA